VLRTVRGNTGSLGTSTGFYAITVQRLRLSNTDLFIAPEDQGIAVAKEGQAVL